MKVLLSSVIVVLCCVQPAAAVEQPAFGYQQQLGQICLKTSQDDRLGLKKTLAEHRIKIHTAVDKVICNGQRLVPFAKAEQAYNVARMLESYEKRRKGHVEIKDIAPAN